MNSDVQNDTGSVKTEFIQVINDFSQYLLSQKEKGHAFLEISKESKSQISNWSHDLKEVNSLQQPFFFQGSEDCNIFIIDSGQDFFKGKSGELLNKILAAMKLTTDNVFICNAGDKKAVHEKIQTVAPKVIITLGAKAGQLLLKNRQPLEEIEGKFYDYQGIKVMPTFHPSLLLKQPAYKRQVWESMQKVMKFRDKQYGL